METFQLMTYSRPAGFTDPSLGTDTILLVDDEEPVQRVVREILERRGYRVLVAGDGTAALRASSEFKGDIQLLLTDVVMPGMSGLEVAKYLVVERPLMKVLYISGYSETVVSVEERMSPGRYFLRKPFLAPMLVGKVREVLDDCPVSIKARN